MTTAAVIEKVQKLLALSKSQNANEAAAAAAAANRLIDQYRLSEADLEIAGQAEELLDEDDSYIYESGKVTPWKVSLVRVLADHYGLSYWNDNYYPEGRKVSRYKLVGRKSDIVVARYMFSWLLLECQRLSDQHAKGQGRIYVASYCRGFVAGVAEQLRGSREEAKKTASTSAIIKLDSRAKEAEEFMYRLHNNLRVVKSKSQSYTDPNAFSAGQTSGRNIHLGQSLNSKATKLLT